MMVRNVERTHVAGLDQPMPGFTTRNIGPANLGRRMDPFVNLDDFVMDRPIFRAHPHAGFSAITYMFEDSAGTFRNRWSFGGDQLIGPGAVHWTQAGSGMLHEEVPIDAGVPCHGLQMFVKLPAAHELADPAAFHLDAAEVPEVDTNGVRVRVLAGRWDAVESPMPIVNDLVWLDVHLEPGSTFTTPAPAGQTAFVFMINGSATSAGSALEEHSGALFGDGDTVVIDSEGGAELLWCSGPPINEPIVTDGPFMMSTRSRLDDASARLRAGEMGRLPPSF
jgi:redox-sensitive bicupin YhaK (pirin superfamily)